MVPSSLLNDSIRDRSRTSKIIAQNDIQDPGYSLTKGLDKKVIETLF